MKDDLVVALEWALKTLDGFVSIHEDGSAYNRDGHEMAGYATRYEKARKALADYQKD